MVTTEEKRNAVKEMLRDFAYRHGFSIWFADHPAFTYTKVRFERDGHGYTLLIDWLNVEELYGLTDNLIHTVSGWWDNVKNSKKWPIKNPYIYADTDSAPEQLYPKIPNCVIGRLPSIGFGGRHMAIPSHVEINQSDVLGQATNLALANYIKQDIKNAKELLNLRFGIPKVSIKKVIFNPPATVVLWQDGDKTVVKANNEEFDPEKGLAMAISKKALGNKGNYFNTFAKWVGEYEKEQEELAAAADKIVASLYQAKENSFTVKDIRVDGDKLRGLLYGNAQEGTTTVEFTTEKEEAPPKKKNTPQKKMTCREKLAADKPKQVGDNFIGGCLGCPCDCGNRYAKEPSWCTNGNVDADCTRCWDRPVED